MPAGLRRTWGFTWSGKIQKCMSVVILIPVIYGTATARENEIEKRRCEPFCVGGNIHISEKGEYVTEGYTIKRYDDRIPILNRESFETKSRRIYSKHGTFLSIMLL